MQYPQLYRRFWPEVGHPEDEWAMLPPREHTRCNDVEERRGFNNYDIWTPDGFSSQPWCQATKGQLRQDTSPKAFVRAHVTPYAYNAYAIKRLLLQCTSTIFSRHDTGWVIRNGG